MEMFSHILIQLGTQAAAAGGDNATGQMPGRGGMAVLYWDWVLAAYVECYMHTIHWFPQLRRRPS